MIMFAIIALHLLSAGVRAQSLSGCEICATSGRCERAYKNTPGQFCGAWYDIASASHRPCCCPSNSQCKLSQFECRCHVPPGNQQQYQYHSNHTAAGTGGEDPYWVVRLVGVVLLFFCCCCCIPACFNRKNDRKNQRGRDRGGGYAAPSEAIPVAMPYDEGNPPPTAPGWSGAESYGSTAQRGFSGGGGGGLGPALGGLAVGTVVGHMMGRGVGHRRDGYFGAGGGGGGGYDIPGDSGGGGYDIAGDSGGVGDGLGGYDIGGDS